MSPLKNTYESLILNVEPPHSLFPWDRFAESPPKTVVADQSNNSSYHYRTVSTLIK